MLPRQHLYFKVVSSLIMVVALLFLTTANWWVYANSKEKKAGLYQSASNAGTSEEDTDATPSVPTPAEEKTSNSLQSLSEYLHDHHYQINYPESLSLFGNRHDIIHFPIHHTDLLTPPPKG